MRRWFQKLALYSFPISQSQFYIFLSTRLWSSEKGSDPLQPATHGSRSDRMQSYRHQAFMSIQCASGCVFILMNTIIHWTNSGSLSVSHNAAAFSVFSQELCKEGVILSKPRKLKLRDWLVAKVSRQVQSWRSQTLNSNLFPNSLNPLAWCHNSYWFETWTGTWLLVGTLKLEHAVHQSTGWPWAGPCPP